MSHSASEIEPLVSTGRDDVTNCTSGGGAADPRITESAVADTIGNGKAALHSEATSRTAAEVVEWLLQAGHVLRGVLASHFAEFDLSDVRYAALRFIQANSSPGCTQVELAEQLNHSPSSISGLVDRMRNDGLLYRLESKSDRRKRVLMLTEQGRKTLAQIAECHPRRMDTLLQRFDAADKHALCTLLQSLVEELSGASRPVSPTDDRSRRPSTPRRIQTPPVIPLLPDRRTA